MSNEDVDNRRKRKEEGKLKKRQRIEDAGGVRPRDTKTPRHENPQGSAPESSMSRGESTQPKFRGGNAMSSHRFGRVMESVPCRNKPRFSTVSMALPGSVLSNCQTKELRTLLTGQIARAATIYHVDEIIVFDDKLGTKDHTNSGWRRHRDGRRDQHIRPHQNQETNHSREERTEHDQERRPRSTHQEFMARLLQYCECPQYLRRRFFPMHPDLQFAGLLAPIDAPHHVRAEDHSPFRDGVVLEKTSKTGNSLVNCGIRNRPVEIDRKLMAGIRCTVKIDPVLYRKVGAIKGVVVSPAAPREHDGTYWGYTTRLAGSINEVFDNCPYEGGYDLKIGTSERGDTSVEEKSFKLPVYNHTLIVFGGVAGIEECVDADESIKLPGSQSKKLFDMWLNTCPYQASRTIRTEEAVLISLSQLSTSLVQSSKTSDDTKEDQQGDSSEESVSEESVSEEEDLSDEESS